MRRWILKNFERWWIDPEPPQDGWRPQEQRFATLDEVLRFLRGLGFDARSEARRHDLQQLAADTERRGAFPASNEELLVGAAWLILRGRLRVWRDRVAASGVAGELDRPFIPPPMEPQVVVKGASAPPPPAPAPAKDPTHWIEIVLLDPEGNPVKDQPYEIVLPDGKTVTGNLDEKGRARYDGIEGGNCRVSFPTLHTTEWRPA